MRILAKGCKECILVFARYMSSLTTSNKHATRTEICVRQLFAAAYQLSVKPLQRDTHKAARNSKGRPCVWGVRIPELPSRIRRAIFDAYWMLWIPKGQDNPPING